MSSLSCVLCFPLSDHIMLEDKLIKTLSQTVRLVLALQTEADSCSECCGCDRGVDVCVEGPRYYLNSLMWIPLLLSPSSPLPHCFTFTSTDMRRQDR